MAPWQSVYGLGLVTSQGWRAIGTHAAGPRVRATRQGEPQSADSLIRNLPPKPAADRGLEKVMRGAQLDIQSPTAQLGTASRGITSLRLPLPAKPQQSEWSSQPRQRGQAQRISEELLQVLRPPVEMAKYAGLRSASSPCNRTAFSHHLRLLSAANRPPFFTASSGRAFVAQSWEAPPLRRKND
jgi:hypothetical protein